MKYPVTREMKESPEITSIGIWTAQIARGRHSWYSAPLSTALKACSLTLLEDVESPFVKRITFWSIFPHALSSVTSGIATTLPLALPPLPSKTKGPALFLGVSGPSPAMIRSAPSGVSVLVRCSSR
jgi:hypothetical protein